jgi:hypothetical protein
MVLLSALNSDGVWKKKKSGVSLFGVPYCDCMHRSVGRAFERAPWVPGSFEESLDAHLPSPGCESLDVASLGMGEREGALDYGETGGPYSVRREVDSA